MNLFKIRFVTDRGIVIFYVIHHSGQSAATLATDNLVPLRLAGYVGRRDITEITELPVKIDPKATIGIVDTIKVLG